MSDLNLSAKSGLHPFAQLYAGGAKVGQVIELAELDDSGEYFANLPAGIAAATYVVVFYDGDIKLASGRLEWDGSSEVERATVQAIRADLATELARMDAAISTRSTLAAGAAMTLTPAYDAAKTAATQTSVSAIPTNPVLVTDTRLANLDASVSSRSTVASIEATTVLAKKVDVPTSTVIAASVRTNLATELARMDAAISTRSTLAAGAAMTLTPAYDAAKTAATQTSVSAIPTNPALATDTRLNNLDAAISTRSTLAAGDLPAAGLTPTQADQLTKVAHLHGIGATLVVTETTRQAGDVVQSVVTEGYTTTVTEV